jgi:parallel beta-helix repeat protein
MASWAEYIAQNIGSYAGIIQTAMQFQITPVYNIVGSGADPTGISDSTDGIMNACNAVPASGGMVWLPPGNFLYSTELEIPVNVTAFIGSGAATVLTPTGAAKGMHIAFPSRLGLEVGNFVMNVSTTLYPNDTVLYFETVTDALVRFIHFLAGGSMAISSNNCVDSLFEKIRVDATSANVGIRHGGGSALNITTRSCKTTNTGSHGIQIAGGSDHAVLENKCVITGDFGISIWNAYSCLVSGNTTIDSFAEGINLDNAQNCIVTDNSCKWTTPTSGTDFGISLFGPTSPAVYTQYNIVKGNQVYQARKSGIALADNAQFCDVSDNTIVNCNQAGNAWGAGVLLYGSGAVYNNIHDNHIDGTTHNYGVNEYAQDGAPNYNTIHDNFVNGAATAEVAIVGALTKADVWTAYTPTVSSTGGTITTASATGKYLIRGKTCFVELVVTVTTNGTGSGNVTATLPRPAINQEVLVGRESGASGKELQGMIASPVVNICNYDGSYPGANGASIHLNGSYQIA